MILDDTPGAPRLAISPQLDGSEVDFLAGFSRHPVSPHGAVRPPVLHKLDGLGWMSRIWPGQPAVPSPWIPCEGGCCLVLEVSPVAPQAAGQWLRFLLSEFLTDGYRLDGWLEVPGGLGTPSSLLIVEGRDIFEGEMDEGVSRWGPAVWHEPQSMTPAARAGSA